MNRRNKEIRKYAEIRSTHITEDGVFRIVHLDGYKTIDDEEEGTVIARVVATKIGDTVHHTVLFADSYDNLDAGVQEELATVKAMLPEIFESDPAFD